MICNWCKRDLPATTEFFYARRKSSGSRTSRSAGRLSAPCRECTRSPEYRAHRKAIVNKHNKTRMSVRQGKKTIAVRLPNPPSWHRNIRPLSASDVACMVAWYKGYRVVDGNVITPRGKIRRGRDIKVVSKKHLRGFWGQYFICSCWQFAAFAYYGADVFEPGILVRARNNELMDLRRENIYIQQRSAMLRECAVRKVREIPAPLNYDPQADPNRAVRENQDLIKTYPKAHWEVVWLAMLEAAKKFDPSKQVPLRGWMRFLIKNRIKDKMRRESVRYHDDAPGYKKIRGSKSRVISTASIFSEGFEFVTGTRYAE